MGVIIILKSVLLDVLVHLTIRKKNVYSPEKFCCRFTQSHLVITQERGHRLEERASANGDIDVGIEDAETLGSRALNTEVI